MSTVGLEFLKMGGKKVEHAPSPKEVAVKKGGAEKVQGVRSAKKVAVAVGDGMQHVPPAGKPGRKPIGSRAMTQAERARRSRAKKAGILT